jgi:hypothetical protein
MFKFQSTLFLSDSSVSRSVTRNSVFAEILENLAEKKPLVVTLCVIKIFQLQTEISVATQLATEIYESRCKFDDVGLDLELS